MVLVIPPEAAANAITKAMRSTAAWAFFPKSKQFKPGMDAYAYTYVCS